MILTRLGNKRIIADKIRNFFPPHDIYVEPFFGAGGMYFNKPKAKYNIVNDIDSDVYNLFTVIMNKTKLKQLQDLFKVFPIHSDLWEYWKKHEVRVDTVTKALRFLFLSNYGYLGKPNTLAYGVDNQKIRFNDLVDQTHDMLFNVMFTRCHFREVFQNLARVDDKKVFIYNDPPYLETDNTYKASDFNEMESYELFQLNFKSGHKFMISEFNHPFILKQAERYNLNVIYLMDRKNIKNVRTEILVTNYDSSQLKFF